MTSICRIWNKYGNNESRNHIYLDTSFAMTPKSDEHQYCNKNAATLGATNFTSSTCGSYKLAGDNDVYTIDAMDYSCHFSTGAIDN